MNYYEEGRREALLKLGFEFSSPDSAVAWHGLGGAALGALGGGALGGMVGHEAVPLGMAVGGLTGGLTGLLGKAVVNQNRRMEDPGYRAQSDIADKHYDEYQRQADKITRRYPHMGPDYVDEDPDVAPHLESMYGALNQGDEQLPEEIKRRLRGLF